MTNRNVRTHAALVIAALVAACSSINTEPHGAPCTLDAQCAGLSCIAGHCTAAAPVDANGHRVLYLDPAGNDDADGATPAQALATFPSALARLQPGDELVLRPGRYGAASAPAFSGQGSEDAPIVVRGDAAGDVRPVIEVSCDQAAGLVITQGTRWLRVQDLEFAGSESAAEGAGGCDGILFGGGETKAAIEHVELRDLYVHDVRGAGLSISTPTNDLVVSRLRVERTGAQGIVGATVDGGATLSRARFSDCTVDAAGTFLGGRAMHPDWPRGHGVRLGDSGVQPHVDVTFERCTIRHSAGSGLRTGTCGTTVVDSRVEESGLEGISGARGPLVIRNTVVAGAGYGTDGAEYPVPVFFGDAAGDPPVADPGGAFNGCAAQLVIERSTIFDDTRRAPPHHFVMTVQYDECATGNVVTDLTLRGNIIAGTQGPHVRPCVTVHAEQNVFERAWPDLCPDDLPCQPFGCADIAALGAGNVVADPGFVCPRWGDEGNLHLRPGAAALGTGLPVDGDAHYQDGAPRAVAAHGDAGALGPAADGAATCDRVEPAIDGVTCPAN